MIFQTLSRLLLTILIIISIGDLGVAKVLDSSTAFARSLVGTPYYLSPELCADMPYRDKSDVWAFGVILYEVRATFIISFTIINL